MCLILVENAATGAMTAVVTQLAIAGNVLAGLADDWLPVLASACRHHKRENQYAGLAKALADHYEQHKEQLPVVIWRDNSPQHFKIEVSWGAACPPHAGTSGMHVGLSVHEGQSVRLPG
jgi:hypothetical protein